MALMIAHSSRDIYCKEIAPFAHDVMFYMFHTLMRIVSQSGDTLSRYVNSSEAIIPVKDNTVYNVSVEAETKAGYGDGSALVQYNTSTGRLPMPFIMVKVVTSYQNIIIHVRVFY